jgi:heterodisulfide reductase subunit C
MKPIKYCQIHNRDKVYDVNYKRWICVECKSATNKCYYSNNIDRVKETVRIYQQDNAENIKEHKKEYRKENSDLLSEKGREYYSANKDKKLEYQHQYYLDNKLQILQQKTIYLKARRKVDPSFRLRTDVSTLIRRSLKKNGSSKNSSVLDYLPYSIPELREHLEKQFQPWMTWENHGIYDIDTWDDNDPTTWTWQLDHIVPQSDLPYISMSDDNFKKCWSLENLRPYSAKLNVIEGTQGIRHSPIKGKHYVK